MQDKKMPKVQVHNLTKKFGMTFHLMCAPENFCVLSVLLAAEKLRS